MNRLKSLIFFIFAIIILSYYVSAIPFIVGRVNDALDGTSANGREIVLWNPSVGINDNVTDIIGPSGNSGTDNTYFIDCDLLTNGCDVGIEIRIMVGRLNNYLTNYTNLTINGAGFQQAENLTLNSPPITNISAPINYANFTNPLNLFCNFSDYDGNLANVTLYGNWSNGWHANETQIASNSYSYNTTFSKNLSDGRYLWACMAYDGLEAYSYSSNYTITVDNSPPIISGVISNASSVICGASYVRVNCTVSDYFTDVDTVYFRAFNQSSSYQYVGVQINQSTYYSDILLDSLGEWFFGCYANDTLGNTANLNSSNLTVRSISSDITLNAQNVSFNPPNPIEGQEVEINATIINNGCSNTGNFVVAFYEGNPDNGGLQIGANHTLSISSLSNNYSIEQWVAVIGNSNIFIKTDINDEVSEYDELNNIINITKVVNSWQTFYGNVTVDKILAGNNNSNITLWFNQSVLSGNIFVTDVESIVSWQSLLPFGKNFSLSNTSNDFNDLDDILNMTEFNDSISNIFTIDGNSPKKLDNFLVYQRNLSNVPVINISDSFITGLLWDSSDDSNGQYDISDKEDVVFLSKINNSQQGSYGIYDYEINIPVKLRQYHNSDSQNVYFYFDLN